MSQCAVPARRRKMATHFLPTRVQTHFFQSLKHELKFTLVSAFGPTDCPNSQGSSLFSCKYLWFQIIQLKGSYILESSPFCNNHYNDFVVLSNWKLGVFREAQPAVLLCGIKFGVVVSKMWTVEFPQSREWFQSVQRYTQVLCAEWIKSRFPTHVFLHFKCILTVL